VAKKDVDLQVGQKNSNVDKTLYWYYYEAVFVYFHMQLPGAVEDLTISSSILTSLYLW